MLLSKTVTITEFSTTIQCHIDILDDIDNFECEDDEQFYITLVSGSENCEVPNLYQQIPVAIIDDGRALDRQSLCMVGYVCEQRLLLFSLQRIAVSPMLMTSVLQMPNVGSSLVRTTSHVCVLLP